MAILFDKHPLVVNKILATIIGLNEAIVLQQVHYWIQVNKNAGRNFHEGRYWTYNTYEEWNEQFPFWSKETIKRVFKKLRNMKLIIVDRFNVYQMDRTLWYTIDYDMLNSILKVSNESDSNEQNDSMDRTQNCPIDRVKLTPPIPENTTEISAEIISPSVKMDRLIYCCKSEEESFENKACSYDKTDGLMDNSAKNNLDPRSIVAKCELENIPEYYRDAVFKAILLLVHDINNYENIKIGNTYVPKDIARAEIQKLDYYAIEHALEKFKEATKTTKVKVPINYLKACIFNAISKINIDLDAEVRYDLTSNSSSVLGCIRSLSKRHGSTLGT